MEKGRKNMSCKMFKVFVAKLNKKKNYIASKSHMTCTLVKMATRSCLRVWLCTVGSQRLMEEVISEESFKAYHHPSFPS